MLTSDDVKNDKMSYCNHRHVVNSLRGLRIPELYLHNSCQGIGAGVGAREGARVGAAGDGDTVGDGVQPQSKSNTTTRLSAASAAAIDTKSVVSEYAIPTMLPVPITVSSFRYVVVPDDSVPVDASLSNITICRRVIT